MWWSPLLLILALLVAGCVSTARIESDAHTNLQPEPRAQPETAFGAEPPDSPHIQQILSMTEAEWEHPGRTARATELLDLLRRGELSEHELDLVYSNAMKSMIKTRSSWPGDYPWRIKLGQSIWFDTGSGLSDIEFARADQPDQYRHTWIFIDHTSPQPTSEDPTLEMGPLDPDSETTEVTVKFSGHPSMGAPYQTIWSGRVEVPVRVQDRLDEVVTPIHSETIDEFLDKILQIRFFDGKYAEVSLFREYFPWGTLALKIEVLFEGEPVAFARTWYEDGWLGYDSSAYVELQETRKGIVLEPTDARFTVRVSGDAEMALRGFDSDKYWSGSFEKPLSEFDVEH